MTAGTLGCWQLEQRMTHLGGEEGREEGGGERGREERDGGLLEVQEVGQWGQEWNGGERTLERDRTKQSCEP